jgi:tetratricopeptide (TPR) repeat protein
VLFVLMACNGAALAVFAIVQRLTSPGGLVYWKFKVDSFTPFGPFVNQNNAGGYLNLCLAAAASLFLAWLGRRNAQYSASSIDHLLSGHDQAGSWWTTAIGRLRGIVAALDAPMLAVTMLLGCILAGVLASHSRGALLALAGGTLATLVAARSIPRRRTRWWPLALAIGLALALVAWLGLAAGIEHRLASLFDHSALLHDARLANWSDSLRAVPSFWLLGSGLGTYGYAYLPFQSQPSSMWHKHAENQYLEALVDGGVVGLALLLTAIGLVAIVLIKSLRWEMANRAVTWTLAGLFILASQCIHASLDLGLYVPANLLLFALVCGAFAGRGAMLAYARPRAQTVHWLYLPRFSQVPTVWLLLLLGGGVFGWSETCRAAAIETQLATDYNLNDRTISPATIERAIEDLTTPLVNRWDDAEAHLHMARLWTLLFRLQAMHQLRSELSPSLSDQQVWNLTDPGQLHAQAIELAQAKNGPALERLRNQPLIVGCLRPAWAHLVRAREACPFLPEVHLELAALCFLADDPLKDVVHLDRVLSLAGNHYEYLYAVGMLDLDAGRLDRAYAELRRSWNISRYFDGHIFAALSRSLTLPQILDRVAPTSPEGLLDVAAYLFGAPQQAEQRRVVLDRVKELLAKSSLPAERQRSLRARLEQIRRLPEAPP